MTASEFSSTFPGASYDAWKTTDPDPTSVSDLCERCGSYERPCDCCCDECGVPYVPCHCGSGYHVCSCFGFDECPRCQERERRAAESRSRDRAYPGPAMYSGPATRPC